jgi:fumarate reductase subunit C
VTSGQPTRVAPYKMPALWWLRRRNYLVFMLRELSPLFVSLFLVRFLGMLAQVREGPASLAEAWRAASRPGAIAFSVVALAFAVLHAVTWFQAGAVILPVKVGGKQVPAAAVVGGSLAAWLVFSAAVLWWVAR